MGEHLKRCIRHGKIAYHTWRGAQADCHRLNSRTGKTELMHVYYDRTCGSYHLGGTQKERPPKKPRNKRVTLPRFRRGIPAADVDA